MGSACRQLRALGSGPLPDHHLILHHHHQALPPRSYRQLSQWQTKLRSLDSTPLHHRDGSSRSTPLCLVRPRPRPTSLIHLGFPELSLYVSLRQTIASRILIDDRFSKPKNSNNRTKQPLPPNPSKPTPSRSRKPGKSPWPRQSNSP